MKPKPTPPKEKADDREGFLKELAALTAKYGISIDGCGCCGSPFLSTTHKKGVYQVDAKGDKLTYVERS